MPELTVSEVRNKVLAAENTITKTLHDLQAETNLTIDRVDVNLCQGVVSSYAMVSITLKF